MPIAVTCPHCQTRYPKIPDSFAGKTVKCKKEDCRQDFLVPVPLSAAELEAAALAALNDAPAQQEAVPAAERQLAVTCPQCDHKWTEPYSKAGKNTLCPECRARVKVPEPKAEAGDDWRQKQSKLPTLAKQNFEKPTDVQDAEATMVSGQSLREAGLGLPELEPRPLKQKILFVVAPLALLALVFFGVRYFTRTRSDGKNDQMMAEAIKEYADGAEESKPPPAEAGLFAAVLQFSAGEYVVRLNDKAKFKDAMGHFNKARQEWTQAAAKDDKKQVAAERYVVGCELAAATLALGGTDEQVGNDVRIRWAPDPATGRQLRANERRESVHGELQRTLGLMTPAEFDLKAMLLRRLTRELAKKGQGALAAELPVMLFTEPEQGEAKAIVAVELYKADPKSELAKRIAEELRSHLADATRPRAPVPATAQTIWLLCDVQKTPTIASPPPGGVGEVLDSSRAAYTTLYLIQGKPDDAVALAQRAGTPAGRLRALSLCAEWSPDPTAALDAAVTTVVVESKKKDPLPQFVILRLALLAAAAGKTDQAKALTDALTDDGLKAWAAGDGVRLRLAAKPEKAAESVVELPDDSKKYRVGHAWGRLAVARNNAALAKDRGAAKEFAGWPRGTIHPFALAGVALGLQDP